MNTFSQIIKCLDREKKHLYVKKRAKFRGLHTRSLKKVCLSGCGHEADYLQLVEVWFFLNDETRLLNSVIKT